MTVAIPRSLRNKRIIAVLVVAALVAAAASALKIIGNAPVKGVISTGSAAGQQPPVSAFDLTPVPVQGSYAGFDYPRGLNRVADNPLVPPVLAMYNFQHRDVESWQLAIAILSIPSGNLGDNNAYQFRKTKPDTYRLSYLTIRGQQVPVMSDLSAGFSKVAFLVHGPYQASISLHGADAEGVGPLDSTFMMVLNSWQWRTP